MSSFDALDGRLQDVLNHAKGVAKTLQDHALGSALRDPDGAFNLRDPAEVIRRHRGALEHAVRQTPAVFPGDRLLADDLRNHLDSLRRDVEAAADYAQVERVKLQGLFEEIYPPGGGVDQAAGSRHNDAFNEAIRECSRLEQGVADSCRLALEGAKQVCADADEAIGDPLIDRPENPDGKPAAVRGESPNQEPSPTGEMQKTGRKKATVNVPMLETLQKTPEAAGWSSDTWASRLDCAKSTVVATAAWKEWAAARFQKRTSRNDRWRRPNKINKWDGD